MENGTKHVIFGDGIKGAHPEAGLENIEATYRVGIGKSGILKNNQLRLLMDHPLGVRSVTNPIPTSGADDPEDIESARLNAPLKILTMERLVSLADFESFALAFAGIGKAQAVLVWNGYRKIVNLTLASSLGDNLKSETDVYKNLTNTINNFKDPLIPFQLDSFSLKLFSVEANILIDPKYSDAQVVTSSIIDALQNKFSPSSMQFGQGITKSEIMAEIQKVKGVIMTVIVALYVFVMEENDDGAKISIAKQIVSGDTISANTAHWDNDKKEIAKTELLTIHSNKDQVIIDVIKKEDVGPVTSAVASSSSSSPSASAASASKRREQ